MVTPVAMEPLLGYHSFRMRILTRSCETRIRTVSDGQFDWGGRLLKSNGGARWWAQDGWKPSVRVQWHKPA